MAYADEVFLNNCQLIMHAGYLEKDPNQRARWPDGSVAYTQHYFGLTNRYDLEHEFPALTLRPTPMKNCIDELLWIWQKRSVSVADLRSRIWDAWQDESGTIGKAYGYQLAQTASYPEGEFNQVDRIRYLLRHQPLSRRMVATMYIPSDLHEMQLYPCAWSLTLQVTNGRLNAVLNQRSQDMLVANNWNVFQYAILLHLFAREADLEVGELLHVIADAHIYDRHFELVEELISRPAYPAPMLWINPDKKDFYDFCVDDFRLEDYRHGPAMKQIPVAI
ncbi:MAG: thymidylate synthase [Eubacteriales bacterium]|nr:thymidylate synthase [Eubacteriales bacterium]